LRAGFADADHQLAVRDPHDIREAPFVPEPLGVMADIVFGCADVRSSPPAVSQAGVLLVEPVPGGPGPPGPSASEVGGAHGQLQEAEAEANGCQDEHGPLRRVGHGWPRGISQILARTEFPRSSWPRTSTSRTSCDGIKGSSTRTAFMAPAFKPPPDELN